MNLSDTQVTTPFTLAGRSTPHTRRFANLVLSETQIKGLHLVVKMSVKNSCLSLFQYVLLCAFRTIIYVIVILCLYLIYQIFYCCNKLLGGFEERGDVGFFHNNPIVVIAFLSNIKQPFVQLILLFANDVGKNKILSE